MAAVTFVCPAPRAKPLTSSTPGGVHGRRHCRPRCSSLGGRLPVNTDGGCIAEGQPIGASGRRQVYERPSGERSGRRTRDFNPYRPQRRLRCSPMSASTVLCRRRRHLQILLAVARPDEVAIRDGNVALSWAKLDDSTGLPNAVLAVDLGPAWRPSVFAENWVEMALAHLGGLLGSPSTVPANFQLDHRRVCLHSRILRVANAAGRTPDRRDRPGRRRVPAWPR